jgi:hypothetical protein
MSSSPAPSLIASINLGHLAAATVQWLWPGWIPLGKITLLDGDSESGKGCDRSPACWVGRLGKMG